MRTTIASVTLSIDTPLVHYHPDAPEVHLSGVLETVPVPLEQLRRHVARRAAFGGHEATVGGVASEPEICNLGFLLY